MELTRELQKEPFWSLKAEEVADALRTDPKRGLSEDEAKRRVDIFGLNIIEKTERTTAFGIFLNQFKSPLILILIFAGLVMVSVAHLKDALFIFIAVVINAALGFYQENKAERALAELKTYLRQRSRVIRDGREYEIDAEYLVPGDLIRLSQGDRVPVDARLSYSNDLQIDESVLTGESLPVLKSPDPVDKNADLADQFSIAFAGTLVTQGVATAIVCRTDFSTELGKITELVAKQKSEQTPLQAAIRKFSVQSSIFLSILTAVVFVIGIYMDQPWIDMFLTSVAIAVSAIPEGLPIALTVILAIGVQRMAKRNGVIRKLIAAEALGSTTVILTDKTGTLTMAKMELNKLIPKTKRTDKELLELALINTEVVIENPEDNKEEWRITGRIMETAIARGVISRGMELDEIKKKISIVSSLPFNAVNKYSVSFIEWSGERSLVFLGAPEILIQGASLSEKEKLSALDEINELANGGERLLGVAIKKVSAENIDFKKPIDLTGLSFEGLITFRDPVRTTVKRAIADVEGAGIRVVIVTGDHKGTAAAVARSVGLDVSEENILEASELRSLNEEQLAARLPRVRVIARVSPFDKVRIVQAFQKLGEVVAMTGDGVNDAPSIRQADIGIAMGSGTAVSRDVADLVLLDDNFETISAAVEEGRKIVGNIKKVIVYLLSNVSNELFLIGGSLLFGLPLPLNALQILWVNFFSDSFPAVAFAFEGGVDGINSNRGKIKSGGIMDRQMKFLILFIGIGISLILLILYIVLLNYGFAQDLVRTFIFASFSSYSLVVAFSLRSLRKSIFSYNPFGNRYLVAGVSAGLILIAAGIYVPILQDLLKTVALPPVWIMGVLAFAVFNIFAMEFGKLLFRRGIIKA